MKLFRRVLFAVGVAALIGGIAKLRSQGEVPAASGGWRQLDGPQFR